MSRKVYVLDTSALLEGLSPPSGDAELLTTPECAVEMRKKGVENIDVLLETRIKIFSPSADSVSIVKEEAKKLGEQHRLSPADIGLIALAIEKEAVLVTNDYSVQNICSSLGIDFVSTWTDGIREVWRWTYRCRGCGRYFDSELKDCPVCGSSLRAVRRK